MLIGTVALSLAACGANGTKTTNNTTETSKMDGMSNEPKNLEEATSMYKEYLEQENAILAENKDLWEKVFMSADKGMTLQEDGKNYGDFLLKTIESAKDKFTEDELKTLKSGAEKIREIENKLTKIEEKYPDAVQKSNDGNTSVPQLAI